MNGKRVKDDPNFIRTSNTGILVNINIKEIKRQQELLAKKKRELKELDQLKSDVSEIKALLSQLIEKNNNG